MNYDKLVQNIKRKQSFLCVGLDTDIDKIPEHLKTAADPIFEFNKAILDATEKYSASVKINTAFYEAYGLPGMQSLDKTVRYINENYPDLFLILDAKRGDIGNTSARYAKAYFEAFNGHAVTVAPYMGSDSVKPFLGFAKKWVVLLALTSNPGASDFQLTEDKETGERLFEKVLRISKDWGTHQNMMYVVGATKAEWLTDIRKIIPKHFLLVPGVGAQGGSLKAVAQHGMTEDCGLLVNSSRGIIYADNTENYAIVAGQKAKELQEQMAALLK